MIQLVHAAVFVVVFVMMFLGLGLGLQVHPMAAIAMWVAAGVMFFLNMFWMRRTAKRT